LFLFACAVERVHVYQGTRKYSLFTHPKSPTKSPTKYYKYSAGYMLEPLLARSVQPMLCPPKKPLLKPIMESACILWALVW
jgi:hypothetical protein